MRTRTTMTDLSPSTIFNIINGIEFITLDELPVEEQELGFSTMNSRVDMERGYIGNMNVKLSPDGSLTETWRGRQKGAGSPAFRADLDSVREFIASEHGWMNKRCSLNEWCMNHPDAMYNTCRDYGLKAVSPCGYTYIIRISPARAEYTIYAYISRTLEAEREMKRRESMKRNAGKMRRRPKRHRKGA